MRVFLLSLMIGCIGPACVVRPAAISHKQPFRSALAPLDLMVLTSSGESSSIFRIDAKTGERKLIAKSGRWSNPVDFVIDACGRMIVADENEGLVEVDPNLSLERVLPGFGEDRKALRVAVDGSGALWILDGSISSHWTIVRLDPESGKVVVSRDIGNSNSVRDFAVREDGELLLLEIDSTGTIDLVSIGSTDTRAKRLTILESRGEPKAVTLGADGTVFVLQSGLVLVDPTGRGFRRVAENLGELSAAAVTQDSIYVSSMDGIIYRIDSKTGDSTALSTTPFGNVVAMDVSSGVSPTCRPAAYARP